MNDKSKHHQHKNNILSGRQDYISKHGDNEAGFSQNAFTPSPKTIHSAHNGTNW